MPELSPGRRLGRYVIRDRLGAGGFARVYLGFDPDLDFEVAIKVLKPQFAEDPVAVERFRREATTAVRLRHPNVVTVLTVGRLEELFDGAPLDAPYLVMDYLPDSLAARLEGTPTLPEADILRIGTEVARGLGYAHNAGVVHRDVKPDNILFGRDGQAVVTDFGIARGVAEGLAPTTQSVVVGTPSYFSPEQARGLPVDGRTDVYALGVTLYQVATGTLPFTGPDWYAVMRQHVEDAPVPPRQRNAVISAELERVILQCLEKAPEDRFETAGELADALAVVNAAQRGAASGTPTVTVDRRRLRAEIHRSARRKRLMAGTLAGVAVIGIAATLVYRRAAGNALALSGPNPDSVAAARSLAGVDTAASSADSNAFAPPLLAATDSLAALASRATLRVDATPGADIRVNGVRVGRGPWRADTLTPGRYTVAAAVVSGDGCVGAETTSVVTLAGSDERTVTLRPSACGALTLNVTPGTARYVLTRLAGGTRKDGAVSTVRSLFVPAGLYRLTVTAPQCFTFSDTVRIAPGAEGKPLRVPLACGPGP